MSTTFNFPDPPTLNQIVVLPNGSQAQWNGTEWVSVGDATVTYPLAISLGGTAGTTAAAARINLGLNTATGEFIVQKDGTAAAPGIAFASEPGLGWYHPSAGQVAMAAGGVRTALFNFNVPAVSSFHLWPQVAGQSFFQLFSAPPGAADLNTVVINQLAGGSASIVTSAIGTATRGNLTLDALSVNVGPGAPLATPAVGQPTLSISKTSATHRVSIVGLLNGVARWGIQLGNEAAETGSNAGSDFAIARYSDAGANVGNSLTIGRANGNANFGGNVYSGPDTGFGLEQPSGTVRRVRFTANGWRFDYDTSTGNLAYINNASAALILFDGAGNAAKLSGGTAWTVLSDKRAKTDIEDWDGGLDKVLSLRPRKFTRIDTGERSIGCVADEAEQGFGELIQRKPGKIGEVEYTDRATLHIDPLFWALVNSVKTLHQRLVAGGL